MVNYASNKERVIEQSNLYDLDDFNQAKNILTKLLVSESSYDKAKNDLEFSYREYNFQMEKLFLSWKKMLK